MKQLIQSFVKYCLLVFLVISAVYSRAQDHSVYDELMNEFAKYDHRLPGSDNYLKCVEKLEKTFSKFNITTHRQTFNTLVPKTVNCKLTVNGKRIPAVYPLAPNGYRFNVNRQQRAGRPFGLAGER